MTLMICPKADKCLRVCEAKFEHERSHFCEEECGAGYIAPCNIILEKPVDVTLQDFYSFVNKYEVLGMIQTQESKTKSVTDRCVNYK